MPRYTVCGVDRESQLDTEVVIEAATAANARAKAELRGVVTEVVGERPPPPPTSSPPPVRRAPGRDDEPQKVQVVHPGNGLKIFGGLMAMVGAITLTVGLTMDVDGAPLVGLALFIIGIIVFSVGRFGE